MQSSYADFFERDMGCTEAEWLRWLPAALGDNPWHRNGQAVAVSIGAGRLNLHWETLPPRVIALMHMPRLRVLFSFAGLDAAQRLVFMKRFDLYMQRGGG